MEERKLQLGKRQIVLRHSSPMLKAVIIVLILFSMAAMGALAWVQSGLQSQMQTMTEQAAAITAQNEELTYRMQNPENVQVIQRIAEEELDLVTPDTVLIQLQ